MHWPIFLSMVYLLFIAFISYQHSCIYLADNQVLMAKEGGIDCLIYLLDSSNELTQRQAAKALANLGVSNENKPKIAEAGGIPKLVRLAGNTSIGVRIEAIAALANLAVNGKRYYDERETLQYNVFL